MIDTKLLDDLAHKLSKLAPANLGAIQQDIEHTFRTTLQNTLSRLNLVSREEFDVQTEVLARTRIKLDELEKQIQELEKNYKSSVNKK